MPVNRTATPRTGVFDLVTFATTTWFLPFALTMLGVTLRTRQRFGRRLRLRRRLVGVGFGVGGVPAASPAR